MMYMQQQGPLVRACEQKEADKAWFIILHHPAVCSDQRNVCTLLQVSKAIQTMLMRSENHLADVHMTGLPRTSHWAHLRHPLKSVALVTNFAAWIPKHAGLIRSIAVSRAVLELCHPDPSDVHDSEHEGDAEHEEQHAAAPVKQAELDSEVMDPILQHSLLLAALQPLATNIGSITTATAASAVAPAPGAFQLQCFSSDFIASAPVLLALPAASRTKLVLNPDTSAGNADLVNKAIAKLSNLQDLTLGIGFNPAMGFYPATRQLSRLTNLEFCIGFHELLRLEHLPGQLQQLDIQTVVFDSLAPDITSVDSNNSNPTPTLNLSHLTALQCLRICNWAQAEFPSSSILPPKLQELTVVYGDPIAPLGVSTLQYLQQLRLSCCEHSAADLLSLKECHQLQDLALTYSGQFLASNLGLAAVWRQLPLRALSVAYMRMTAEQAVELLKGIGAATTLTSLEYKVTVPYGMEDPPIAEPARRLPLKGNDLFWWLASPDATRIPTCELLGKGLVDLRSLKLGFNGQGYSQPDVVRAMHRAKLAREAALGSGVVQDEGITDHAMPHECIHLTALQKLTHLDFRGVDVASTCEPFVNPHVVARLLEALTELKELHLVPGGQAGLSRYTERCLGLLTGLKSLNFQGFREQGPGFTAGLGTPSLKQCLWELTHLTGLTALNGFESCGPSELQKFWDVVRGVSSASECQ